MIICMGREVHLLRKYFTLLSKSRVMREGRRGEKRKWGDRQKNVYWNINNKKLYFKRKKNKCSPLIKEASLFALYLIVSQNFPRDSENRAVICFVEIVHFDRCEMKSKSDFDFHPLVTKDVEHLFKCSSGNWISYFEIFCWYLKSNF